MKLADDFRFFFGAASGQSRAALRRLDEPDVMINYATQNNEPWDGIDRLFVDSGGYSFMKGKGEYGTSDREYLEWLAARDPHRWALRDYPCEPDVLEAHGRSVEDHQQMSLDRHRSLLSQADEFNISGEPVAVLQGWSVDDYLRAVDQYRDHGLLTDHVGVGSVCRRHSEAEIAAILTRVADALPGRVSLHAFGVKTSVLKQPPVREVLSTSDSLAYDFAARRRVAAELDARSFRWQDVAREMLQTRFRLEQLFDDTADDAQTALSGFKRGESA